MVHMPEILSVTEWLEMIDSLVDIICIEHDKKDENVKESNS